jgi:hypothetical protein
MVSGGLAKRAGAASSVVISRIRRCGVLGGAFVLALGSAAQAQDRIPSGVTVAGPTITGSPVVGNTLAAGGGRWGSSDPARTLARWEWWRCDNPAARGCTIINRAGNTVASWPFYKLTDADLNSWIAVGRYVQNGSASVLSVSAATGPVRPVPTPEPPPPVVTPAPTPEPTPAPTFVAPAPTPVPTTGQVLHSTATQRMMKPSPTIRMRGELTTWGAHVTSLTIRAPRRAKISVRCSGSSCPRKRWSSTQKRKKSLTRASAFQRVFTSGTKLTVSVTRKGYLGKRTVFTIRRGKAPLRRDMCLSTAGKAMKCPAG